MDIVKNTFRVNYRDIDGVKEPIFEKDLSFACDFKQDHFEVSVFNVSEPLLQDLKNKYIWISQESLEMPDIEF